MISNSLDLFLSQYDNIIVVRDFNAEMGENMNAFFEGYSLGTLIKEPIRYKNPSNPTCIYLILTKNISLAL